MEVRSAHFCWWSVSQLLPELAGVLPGVRGLEQGVFSDPGSLLPWAGRGGRGCVVSLSPRLHLWTVLRLKVLEQGLQVWP